MTGVKGKCLVDTNVLIYATLEDDPRFKAAQRILFESPQAQLFASVQNLAEMYPNLTGPKMQVADEPQLARAKIDSVSRLAQLSILPVTHGIVRRALELCQKYRAVKQKYFDMQLVSAMLEHRIPVIITENEKDFSSVTEIRAINPFG